VNAGNSAAWTVANSSATMESAEAFAMKSADGTAAEAVERAASSEPSRIGLQWRCQSKMAAPHDWVS
jgi:hypothetical protein